MGSGAGVRRDHQLKCSDLSGSFYFAQISSHTWCELMILQQHRLGADPVQYVYPMIVNVGLEVPGDQARGGLLAQLHRKQRRQIAVQQ